MIIQIDTNEFKKQLYHESKKAMHFDDLPDAVREKANDMLLDGWHDTDSLTPKEWQQTIVNSSINALVSESLFKSLMGRNANV